MTAESKLEIVLIMWDLDTRIVLLKIYMFLSTFLTKKKVTKVSVVFT